MPQAVDCDLFLYSLLFQHKDLEQVKEELTKNFSDICEWFKITSSAFTLGRIKLNLSFSLPKTEKGQLEFWTYNMVTSKSSNTWG